MKVLVTGGSGFIGGYVTKELDKQGHDWLVLDKPHGDVLNINHHYPYLNDVDAVIHLAGQLGTAELFGSELFDQAVDTNVKGTQRVLEFCRVNNARFIGITMPDVWANVYQATKKCSRILATAWHESYGVPVTHVRAFNAFGVGQKYGPGHPQKIIPTFSSLAYANKPIPIWGDGTQTVDLVSASDVASVLVQSLEAPGADEVIDAGTKVEWSVRSVADMVCAFTLSQSPLCFSPMRAGERAHTRLCAQGEGWEFLDKKPTFNLEDLIQTIESYRP